MVKKLPSNIGGNIAGELFPMVGKKRGGESPKKLGKSKIKSQVAQ